jgi:mono/diheme cytochrome c family protein
VLYWDDPAFAAMTAGGGRIAAVTAEGVRVFDPTARRFLQYPLPGVTGAALDAMGRLHVAAGAVYYAEDAMGQLVARVTARVPMRSLTFSGSRLWLVAGGALGAVEGDALAVADEVRVPAEASLRPSASGDVWVLGPATLERYGPDDSPDRRLWEETVRPVFARRCTPCHQPGGTANVDLSTYAAWVMRRASVRTQVLDLGAMPPNPPALAADDRAALARWLGSGADAGVDASVPMDVRDAGAPMDVRDAGPRDTGADVRDAGVPMDVRDAGPRDVGADVRDVGVDVRTDAGAATMTAVQAIFTRACVSCHGASGGLNLSTAAMSRTNLVNRPAAGGACASSGVIRVVPTPRRACCTRRWRARRRAARPCRATLQRSLRPIKTPSEAGSPRARCRSAGSAAAVVGERVEVGAADGVRAAEALHEAPRAVDGGKRHPVEIAEAQQRLGHGETRAVHRLHARVAALVAGHKARRTAQ